MRVIKTPTSLGCLGMKWNNLRKVSKAFNLDNCCPLERTVLICVRFTVSCLALLVCSLPLRPLPSFLLLLIDDQHWSVSSALPRPATFLGDFKSTWILSFNFFTSAFSNNLHSVFYWNQLPLACEMCSFLPNSTFSDIGTIILKYSPEGNIYIMAIVKSKKKRGGSFLADGSQFPSTHHFISATWCHVCGLTLPITKNLSTSELLKLLFLNYTLHSLRFFWVCGSQYNYFLSTSTKQPLFLFLPYLI